MVLIDTYIVEAIVQVHLNGVYLFDLVSKTILEHLHQMDSMNTFEELWIEKYDLTTRELEVVKWIKKGYSNKVSYPKYYEQT